MAYLKPGQPGQTRTSPGHVRGDSPDGPDKHPIGVSGPVRVSGPTSATRLAATGIAVDGPNLLVAAPGIELLMVLPPAECVAIAAALLRAACVRYGRHDWPPVSLPAGEHHDAG